MRKILIVEDDESIGELLRDYLEINGFSVDICMNGTEGLKRIRDGEYDLLILDIMLPGMNGYEILKKIRDEKDIPVLIVSAKKEEFDKIHGLKLGADDYITKPFSPGELVARVNAHIAKYERLRNKYGNNNVNSITIRGLEIQKDSRRVFVNGKEVNLAQKEFDVLLFLAQNPNRVFSREEIFDRVWGMDALGDAATVTVHIGRIREKIESDPSNPQYIETVWGAGYRLRA
ncbi:MAG TPA: DNA-binding response regulator [Hungateiclostridium thermocellum]|jgi:two-component system OmpR family response regulator|uniref:Stage 0 sporulation protein A homolog n=2 Tax=Acetivibrio thermocellus TaxID=1515 RepID=A3DJY6_ACET2|nr:response regulator transcription factor [Acetivibrio thermocellus]CDG37548.1 two component transcriptional regulator [Acetivibrio thermocellus BC1]ABN54265.1 two component transcriptional regulator, winged helix family [Acetivibrio thermocellus ATCC 27405]ADU73699.1 two component transcriptional regulator, winged helix family [Acetivibrio thermocellus DSM 1313]ALX07629.1 two component transcriptional regulator, winged helix family [Acetivibrio thermocellus AD2]ANV75371.1 two component trans